MDFQNTPCFLSGHLVSNLKSVILGLPPASQRFICLNYHSDFFYNIGGAFEELHFHFPKKFIGSANV